MADNNSAVLLSILLNTGTVCIMDRWRSDVSSLFKILLETMTDITYYILLFFLSHFTAFYFSLGLLYSETWNFIFWLTVRVVRTKKPNLCALLKALKIKYIQYIYPNKSIHLTLRGRRATRSLSLLIPGMTTVILLGPFIPKTFVSWCQKVVRSGLYMNSIHEMQCRSLLMSCLMTYVDDAC